MSFQTYYVSTLPGKTKKIAQNSLLLIAVRSVELIIPNVHRKSFTARFFSCLLENSFISLLTEHILRSLGFYQKFIFKINMVNFSL